MNIDLDMGQKYSLNGKASQMLYESGKIQYYKNGCLKKMLSCL